MERKHTPGPWLMEPTRDRKRVCITAKIDSWLRLECEVSTDDCDYEMGMANARLIAAAPDLLAACEALVERAGMVSIYTTDQETGETFADALKAAIAIAKATGGAQ